MNDAPTMCPEAFSARFAPAPDAARLGAMWRRLELRAAPSFFTSWTWLGSRLPARFPDPWLLEVRRDGEIVALALFNRRTLRRGTELHLHSSGVAAIDSVFIEHNLPLVAQDAPEALSFMIEHLAGRAAGFGLLDRLAGVVIGLPGVPGSLCAAARNAGTLLVDEERSAPYRDLAKLRGGSGDVLAEISANARAQIRRSLRSYAKDGDLRVERARTEGQAARYFGALVQLHRAHWNKRGLTGAFDDTTLPFHETLISTGLDRGDVDLLRVSAGSRTIGYLYNFVCGGIVSAYQSGFAYDDASRHEKPGLTAHYAAIGHYLDRRDVSRYDFLAGAARYKTTLADCAESLFWARFVPNRFSIASARLLGRAFLRSIRHPASPRIGHAPG